MAENIYYQNQIQVKLKLLKNGYITDTLIQLRKLIVHTLLSLTEMEKSQVQQILLLNYMKTYLQIVLQDRKMATTNTGKQLLKINQAGFQLNLRQIIQLLHHKVLATKILMEHLQQTLHPKLMQLLQISVLHMTHLKMLMKSMLAWF